MIRRSLLPLICLGLLQIAAYYVAGALARVGDGVAVPQPDTLLYCQAARRIAEGHPFSYAPGEPVSTGTTSVAYPFALAALYALGAKGSALPTAGFLLNAVFYLMFLAGWGVAIGEWLKRPLARWTAWSLAALSPLMQNVLEPAAIELVPEIGELKQKLLDAGAIHAQMTGSGSAVFGLFENEEAANNALPAVSDAAFSTVCYSL